MMEKNNVSNIGKAVIETENETGQDQIECYGKEPDFKVCFHLPRIIFKSIITEPKTKSHLRQLSLATVRRFFYLTENWELKLQSTRYPELAGTIVIPDKVGDKKFEFDGASIPVPWLVSLLTVGILRPLGVLLIASIVHDYAFRYGRLKVSHGEGEPEDVAIPRDRADALFRDIINCVTGNRVIGFLGWYFVRLGFWLFVRYDGKFGTGKKPYSVLFSFIGILALLAIGIHKLSLAIIALSFLAIYLAFYLVTLNQLRVLSAAFTTISIVGLLFVYLVIVMKLQ